MVPHAEEDERERHDHHDRPEVDQLSREDGRVAVGQHGEVIALDVKESQDYIWDSILALKDR